MRVGQLMPVSSVLASPSEVSVATLSPRWFRGTASSDPANVGYTLQELRQAVVERAGARDRLFGPVPANEIVDLEPLLGELQFVNDFLQGMCREDPAD